MSKKGMLIGILLVAIMMLTGCLQVQQKGEGSGELLDIDNAESSNQQQESKKESEEESQKIVEFEGTKQIGEIEMSNIRVTLVEKNKCEFSADVKNLSEAFLEATNIEIRAINQDGEVDEIFGGIISELAGYESFSFVTYILNDITDVKDFEIESIKE